MMQVQPRRRAPKASQFVTAELAARALGQDRRAFRSLVRAAGITPARPGTSTTPALFDAAQVVFLANHLGLEVDWNAS